jgi:plasmid stabilization system protein ParE
MRGRPAAEIVRRMPVPPYLIYYRVDDARRVVEVITIRHGKRRPPKSFP